MNEFRKALSLSPVVALASGMLLHCGASTSTTSTSTSTPTSTTTTTPTSTPILGGPHLPETPRQPVVTDYHGTKVTDDYQWLENATDPAVQQWSDAENRTTRWVLDGLPDRTAIKERVRELLTSQAADHFALRYQGGALFALEDQPPKQQPFLVVLKSPDDLAAERTLLDPNVLDASGKTAIDFFVPSHDGKLVAVSLSEGGSESGSVHVYEVATGKPRADVIPRVNGGTAGGSLTWNADASGFYYTRYPRAGERPPVDLDFYQQVYFHKLGTDTKDDRYAIGKDFPRIAETALDSSDDGKLVLARVANGDGGEVALYLLARGKWSPVSQYADKIVDAHFGKDGSLYLLSRLAKHGQILRLSPATTPLARAEVVVPEADAVIEQFAVTASRLYVNTLVGGPSEVRVVTLPHAAGVTPPPSASSAAPATVALLPISSVAQIEAMDGDDVVLRNESFVEPAGWYRFSATLGKTTKTALFKTTVADMRDAEVVREMATSKDGTKIPLNIVLRKGTKLDGANPVLLGGYGGFGVSRTPHFNPLERLWLDAGGVYVVTNLRGGGEYGEEWRLAGNLTKKQNVFDDFYACARLLVDERYTRPERLAIIGGSNGGLLMGAELTQHPETFRAVVSFVGIYDMLRVETTPNGSFNVTEYGTVKDKAQFDALYGYSPLHRVKDGTAYPSVLFLTGANDPRVTPFHSRKMTARLQAATSSKNPVLLRTSADTGHGIGTPLGAEIEEDADVYAFMLHELGVPFAARK